MIEHVHKHIISELQQNTKTDIIFIISAITLNLLILAINSGMVEKSRSDQTYLIVIFLFVSVLILVNMVVIVGLQKGKQTRTKLLNGLMQMYEDQNVAKYYDASLLGNYNTRYNLFMMVVVLTGLVSIAVPLIMR